MQVRMTVEGSQGHLATTKLQVVERGVDDLPVQFKGLPRRHLRDEVEQRLTQSGLRPTHVEGYNQAEWVLIDYVDFVVHVFSEKARKFYDLERLWKSAKRLEPGDLKSVPKTRKKKALMDVKVRVSGLFVVLSRFRGCAFALSWPNPLPFPRSATVS